MNLENRKSYYSIALCLFFSLALTLNAQKVVYIPGDFNRSWADDYCNKNGSNGTISSIDDLKDDNERWSKNRSYETDNIICMWETGFGTDVSQLTNPSNPSSKFDLRPYLENCEKIFDHHVNTLHATWGDGANLKKYKFLFLISYTTDWIAYGGGYDYVIGAMWLCPAAMGLGSYATYPYFTLSHELFHAMSYQCYSDRPNDTYRAFQDAINGPFWERSANFAAAQMYPNVDNDFARYMYATQNHFLSSRRHYTTSFFLENLTEVEGELALGELWKNNKKDEHAMSTARRVFFDDDQAKVNDFVCLTAMKNMTWDYPTNSNGAYFKSLTNSMSYNTDATGSYVDEWSIIQKKHRTILYAIDYEKRHFAVRDCQAPQDYGYNAIQIFPEKTNPDGSATFKMRFRGHTESDDYKKPGWRWGFVAIKSDGTPRYGTIYSSIDQTVSFTKESGDKEIWLVVSGAPTEHNSKHNYTWEAGFPKYYRYPYEVRFDNAVPIGYNSDYEGAKSNGSYHSNGGGWVASTATVASSAYVGPNAKVLGSAKVSDNARIEDFAIIKGSAQIYDNAVVKENAMVFTNAKVYGDAIVSGSARVFRGSEIYGNAFVTDNAFLIMTKVYGNAIVCGNLWQRDNNSFEIGGTCVAGGDSEAIGFIASGDTYSGAEISGTFLQWPENANNQRIRKDGKGNLSVTQINSLKENWNDIVKRFNVLNFSISSSTANNPNYDINTPYNYFVTDTEMNLNDVIDEGEFKITNNGSYLSVTGEIPNGTLYWILNEAGVEVKSSTAIYTSGSISIPSSCQSGTYIVKIESDGNEYCEVITK